MSGAGGRPRAPQGGAPRRGGDPGELRSRVQSYYAARLEERAGDATEGGCCNFALTPGAAAESGPALEVPAHQVALHEVPAHEVPAHDVPAHDVPAHDVPVLQVPSFGCGEPTLLADLRPGEAVLDLGSGAGLDAFRAAEAVGPSGSVVGVDMTPAMLDRARAGAERLGLPNVRFEEGFIEALPLAEATVDVVLSNCVVNLSGDKPAVFREAFRVLRPGGRLAISDVLRRGERLTAPSEEGWCACIDGAESPERYRDHLRAAGFSDIDISPPPTGTPEGGTYSATVRARRPRIRPAAGADLPRVRELLARSSLPLAGLPDGDGSAPASADPTAGSDLRLFVLDDAPAVAPTAPPVGVVGLETYGPAALLRSLAVREEARGRGLGTALVRHAERTASAAGARHAYALTTTAHGLLESLGYTRVARDELPAALHASEELRGACPAEAAAFVRSLDGGG